MLMQHLYRDWSSVHQQIGTLKVFNNSVIEVNPLKEYHVESENASFNVIIKLSDNFPNEPPLMFVQPIIQHPWIDIHSGQIQGAPGLINYSSEQCLGHTVRLIIMELECSSLSLLKDQSSNKYFNSTAGTGLIAEAMAPSPSFYLATNVLDNPTNIKCTESSKSINLPYSHLKSFATSVPQLPAVNTNMKANICDNLSNLSLDELKQLADDTEFFDDFTEEIDIIQELNAKLDTLLNEIENLAQQNESKEFQLNQLKTKLSSDMNTLKNLNDKCFRLNKDYVKKTEDYEPQHIRELLQIAASTADCESESFAEQFLNSKIDIQTFLVNYTNAKKLSSLRKAKEERLGQLL